MGTTLIRFGTYLIVCMGMIFVGREISDTWWSGWMAGVIAIAVMQIIDAIYNKIWKKDRRWITNAPVATRDTLQEGYRPTSDVATPDNPPRESGLGEERKTKLVKVTDEEGRTEIYQVPEDFYREILETYGDFQEFLDCANDHDKSFYSEAEYSQANDLCYNDLDGKTALMGCPTIQVDTEIVEK